MVTKEALHLHKELISLCSELRAAFLMCWGSALSRSAGAWSSRSNKHISTNSIAWISFTSILWRVLVLLKGGGLADTAGAGVFFSMPGCSRRHLLGLLQRYVQGWSYPGWIIGSDNRETGSAPVEGLS